MPVDGLSTVAMFARAKDELNYGSTFSGTAVDATRQEQFSHEVISLLESYNHAKDGTLTVPSEYLEAVAIRR